jgi:AcrR family transcriptional regulator
MVRQSSRDAILDRAAQLASVVGLNGVTIGGLAAEVGMSKGGICAHFPTKSALQLATVERARERFRAAVIDPSLEAPAGVERLRRVSAAWFDYLASNVFRGGCFFNKAILDLDGLDNPQAGEAIRGALEMLVAFLERNVRDAVAMGQLRDNTDPRLFALELHGLHAVGQLRRALRLEDDPMALARQAAEQLFDRHSAQ